MKNELVKEFDTAIGLWSGHEGLTACILDGPEEHVFELVEVLAAIIRYHSGSPQQVNENFAFTANTSMSGGSHPCAAPECRAQKVDSLVSFAALYADEIYIQSPFESIASKGEARLTMADRHEILNGLLVYSNLRPLIERGLISYAFTTASFCNIHLNEVAKPLNERIRKKEADLKKLIYDEIIDRCAVTFNFSNKKSPFFEISGPEEAVEHGKMYFHAYQPSPPIFKRFSRGDAIKILSKTEIEDSNVLDYIINPILEDLTQQEWHTSLMGTSYLCDNRSHVSWASKTNSTAFAASSSAFAKGLQHYLPAIYSNDTNVLLDLRQREEESFFVYRDKLRKLLQKTDGWDEKEVSRVFRDEILPEVNLIGKKVADWKKNSREGIAEKVLFGSGTVAVGLYAGMLPANIGQIVAAIGGGAAIAGALMDLNKTFKEKQQARANDFYFLWQASK